MTTLLRDLAECADEIGACGAGNEAAVVRKAMAEITSLRAQLDEARTKIARLVAILDHENPWDQKHVNELNESMIDIRALLSESKT